MRPQKPERCGSGDLFRSRLDQIINLRHELVRLAEEIDWSWIDDRLADLYHDAGRPAVPTRFMVGLLFLKHIYGLSDEGVCERWVMVLFPILHRRGVFPTRAGARTIRHEPLAQAHRGSAGLAAGGDLARGPRHRGTVRRDLAGSPWIPRCSQRM